LIGETIAHYEITGLLGKGGMGEVYRARDTKLGRDVALKILPDDVAQDAERRARFEREARAIAALNHPNVVTIYAVEEAAGRVLLSMEVIEGQTLGELVPEGGLPLDRLLDLAAPLADALATAHARGITHRDLKPANIMVSKEGRVTVLDFGLAKLVEDDGDHRDKTMAFDATAEGRVIGTTAYMSPEQAEGKLVDARSDVFSLGVLLYQMATGEKPFVGDTPISTITSILRDEPRPMNELKPELPTHLGRIIARCLQKDPEQRYESAKGLRFDLENLREDSSSPSVVMPASDKPGGKSRMLLAGAALVTVIVVASVFLLRGGGGDSERLPKIPEPASVAGDAVAADPVVVVFPFENRGEAQDLYFADGITDEIATRLVGMDGLSVLSRSSARNYDRAGKTLEQIASDLGVDYVLEGSVRWQRRSDGGSQVRVSPVLVHAPKDVQVWAESYDRDMSEIFAIQTEIASAVATQIGAAISPSADGEEFSKPQDMEAYHLFLRARQAIDRGQLLLDEWSVARTLLLNALEKDPTYSVAWAYLARVEAGFCHFNWDRSEERLNAARRAAARARELAPGSAEEHLAHGYVFYWGEKRFPEATREFEAALELRPADVETMEALGFVARRGMLWSGWNARPGPARATGASHSISRRL
jgi:TolB-like protein/tRNA A-37 threonylcarbamoyl transferase component Bud32